MIQESRMQELRCANCGKAFTAPRSQHRKYCSRKCLYAWKKREGPKPGIRREREWTPVKICVPRPLGLKPEFEPERWKVYDAERYNSMDAQGKHGYVINVNGHRINVRENECVEVEE